MDLSIIFRSCDTVDCFSGRERIVTATKQELILRSLNSLLRSMAVANSCYGEDSKDELEMDLTIIDDHSTDETQDYMDKLCRSWGYNPKMLQVEGEGNGDSLKTNYEWGLEQGKSLLFFVEDDYIHHSDMLLESLEFYANNVGVRPGMDDMVVHPCDYPDRYYRSLHTSWILPGKARHWRSIRQTTCTFLMSRNTLEEHWDKYMGFTQYGKDPGVTEDTTINRVYDTVNCFSPMPTLSLHLQFETCISPFTDWEAWWEANKVDLDELSIGSGGLHPSIFSTESSPKITE